MNETQSRNEIGFFFQILNNFSFRQVSVFLKQIFYEGRGKHVQDNLNGSCVEKTEKFSFQKSEACSL